MAEENIFVDIKASELFKKWWDKELRKIQALGKNAWQKHWTWRGLEGHSLSKLQNKYVQHLLEVILWVKHNKQNWGVGFVGLSSILSGVRNVNS